MNRYIKVNTEALRNDSGKILELLGEVERQFREIYEEVNVIDGMWDGPANETFVAQFVSDYEMFAGTCSFIRSFAEDLGNAAAEYERCDEGVREAIKAIKV